MYDKFMAEAIAEAQKAESCGEVPVGAVVEKDGVTIGRGHNLTETLKDPTAHAEVLAIRDAAGKLGGWRLLGCNMYVTCEPCAMCAGAIVLARVKKAYIGAMDPKSGACGSVFNVVQEQRLNHYVEIETGVMQAECESMMKDFFKKRRRNAEGIHI
ncbi:MAG: tRNA adenosine(34) deaminase TadA [Clostridiales bacterium]|nr:tRNA adenosine(34) deaminase TadA [Clostridiales bacterium]